MCENLLVVAVESGLVMSVSNKTAWYIVFCVKNIEEFVFFFVKD